ncbi:hypothetical protein [Streptomyces sp. NPDC049879]|uniref:hypothetical protein n=1 Tax=Streptomyces sp. NPDC049879 TaxID=3365598 RepID=UPI0037BE1D28
MSHTPAAPVPPVPPGLTPTQARIADLEEELMALRARCIAAQAAQETDLHMWWSRLVAAKRREIAQEIDHATATAVVI